jgi:DNA-binding NarL/FixJ family response regulator
VRALAFDVLLLDMSMPGKSGIELIKQVKAEKPKLRVLVLSMHEDKQYAVRAIKAGASGYVTKDSAARSSSRRYARSPAAARSSRRGGRAAGARRHAGAEGRPNALSDREFEVFQLLVAGER